jgi:hypothetical protein
VVLKSSHNATLKTGILWLKDPQKWEFISGSMLQIHSLFNNMQNSRQHKLEP